MISGSSRIEMSTSRKNAQREMRDFSKKLLLLFFFSFALKISIGRFESHSIQFNLNLFEERASTLIFILTLREIAFMSRLLASTDETLITIATAACYRKLLFKSYLDGFWFESAVVCAVWNNVCGNTRAKKEHTNTSTKCMCG